MRALKRVVPLCLVALIAIGCSNNEGGDGNNSPGGGDALLLTGTDAVNMSVPGMT